MSKAPDGVVEAHEARQSVLRVFKDKWNQMSENSNFYRLEQYSNDQLAKMSKDSRVPYVWDYITQGINTYIGIQRDRRTEIFFYPREGGDALKAEILNACKESTLAQNDFIYLESDVFQDGLVEKIGAVSYEWTTERDKTGALKMRRIPPRQLMWDLNSFEFDKEDANWISRHRRLTKADLIARWPDKKKEILAMSMDKSDIENSIGNVHSAYMDELLGDNKNGVTLINYWKRIWEDRWYIMDKQSQLVYPKYYDTKSDAEKKVKGLVERGADPEGLYIFKDKTKLVNHVECANEIEFEDKVLDEPFIPIDIYHPFLHDGDWWCPVDTMKDSQRFINKMASMIDHWIATKSKGVLLIEDTIPEVLAKKIEDSWGKTGGAFRVPDIEGIKIIEQKGPDTALFQMMEAARGNLEDHAGGRNFQGKKETASESGVAVRTRIEQGGLAGFVVYDNLRRWKIGVGDKIAWYLTHNMSAAQKVRIEGEELVQETMQAIQAQGGDAEWFNSNPLRPGIGFLEVNTTSQNTIEDIKVDVIVDEARWSISKNESILQQINLAMQSNPLLAGSFDPMTMIELMNLPFSQKEKAKQRTQENMKQQQALEEKKATKPPSLSASIGDVDKLDPNAAAQLLAMFGIQADPNAIQTKEQMKVIIEQKQAELKMLMDREKHQMDMEGTKLKIQADMASTAIKLKADAAGAEQKLNHTEAANEQKLQHQERSQAYKEREQKAKPQAKPE